MKMSNKNRRIVNVYKYMRLDFLISTIKNGIYLAAPDILNDPFEYDGLKYFNNFKIGCLTSSFRNKKMWSIYGDRHKGCCVQLIIDLLDNIKGEVIDRVNYTSKVVKDRTKLNVRETKKYLLKKDKKWIDEKEIRVIFDKKCKKYKKYFHDDKRGNTYFKCRIRTVYFGAKSQLCENYLDILSELKKESYNHDIKIKKMVLSTKSYGILVKEFNIE